MVDGVNFNPFTGKVFTTDEISKLDTDKNGTVSSSELQEGMSWLSGQEEDIDGDVQIGNDSSSAGNVTNQENSNTQNIDINAYLTQIQDEYIEKYIQQNPELSAAEKSALVVYLKEQATEYINEAVKNNMTDTDAMSAALKTKLDEAIQTRNETQAKVNEKMELYKNSVDSNFDNLAEYTDKADDDYVTSNEFNEMKQQTVNYLMGAIMNGSEDADFMKNFDVDYKNNANYQTALKAIEELKSCADPAKMDELITTAETALSNFLGKQNVDGTSKLNNAVVAKDAADTKAEADAKTAELKTKLASVNDQLLESMSNMKTRTGMWGNYTNKYSSDDIQNYEARLNKILDKFISEYTGDGTNIEAEYKAYIEELEAQNQSALTRAENDIVDSADSYQNLKDVINNAGTYVNGEEEANIISTTVDFIINELSQGKYDISLLAQIYPEYASDSNFTEAKSLIDGLESSITREEDLEKVKQLLTTMMQSVGADKISDGVKNKEVPAISISDIDYEQFTSSIPGYDDNASWETSRFRKSSSAKDAIQDLAKQQLESLKPQLMAMLKEQLGADYDEAKINDMLDDAIYQTINDFSESGFGTKKSGLLKRRGTVNIKQIVDAFLTKFQEISANKAEGTASGKNPVGLEEIMADTSLSDAFQDKSSKKIRDKSAAKLEVKTQINIIANQLKAKLKDELGSNYNSSQINSLVEQATLNVVNSLEPTNYKGGFLNLFNRSAYVINTNDIANKFYDEFNKLYESAAAGTSATGTTSES